MIKVIGIVGQPASGKDSASEYLGTKGFAHISSGDFLRARMRERNIPTDRAHVSGFAKEMRSLHGNHYPINQIIDTIKDKTVVSGLRNIAEVEEFRKRFGKDFFLIAIDAPIEVRYARIHGRNRHGDAISFEQFRMEEERERGAESGSHEVDRVVGAADVTIKNIGTKEELFVQLDNVLKNR